MKIVLKQSGVSVFVFRNGSVFMEKGKDIIAIEKEDIPDLIKALQDVQESQK